MLTMHRVLQNDVVGNLVMLKKKNKERKQETRAREMRSIRYRFICC